MRNDYSHLSLPNAMLHFQLSKLARSSQYDSESDASDVDDGFVFDIHPSFLVDYDKVVIEDMIGEGSDSIVYKGWYEYCPVAIKVIHPEKIKEAPFECKAKFQREVNLLSRIQHPNVVKFIGACVEPSLMLITELLDGGSLQRILKKKSPTKFSLERCLYYAIDVSKAMEHLHANNIIHRDLKPGNLLLTKGKNQIKVADFGLARENLGGEMTCEAGTYRYMAPELFSKDLLKGQKKSYDHKVDVYSFAMILWSLIQNQTPFNDRNSFMAAYATMNNMRPSLDGFPEEMIPLVESCWVEDPKLRPEFREISKILVRILQNFYKEKINALDDINENEDIAERSEEESPIAQLTPTSFECSGEIEPNGGTNGESQTQANIESETPIGSKRHFINSGETKPAKKNKMKRFFSFFRGCFVIKNTV